MEIQFNQYSTHLQIRPESVGVDRCDCIVPRFGLLTRCDLRGCSGLAEIMSSVWTALESMLGVREGPIDDPRLWLLRKTLATSDVVELKIITETMCYGLI